MLERNGPVRTSMRYSDLQNRAQFFRDHAGYVVGARLRGALELARAEIYAEENDFEFDWEWDTDSRLEDQNHASTTNPDGWCHADCGKDHEILGCIVRTPDDDHAASLWAIIDPDRHYRRVVQAELASEIIAGLRRAAENDAQATRDLAL